MKFTSNVTILLLFILSSLPITAQTFTPFGEFSAEETFMKQCSFDPDADAIVLLDEAESDYNDAYHLVTKHHVRIKVLKEKGISNADISIHFWRKDGFEELNVTRAETFNLVPGEVPVGIKVERKSFFKRDINERYGEVAFTFPAVKTGSILEYEYVSEMKHYGGLEDWYFQESRPVLRSKYNLVIVPNTEFTYRVVKRIDFNAVVTPNSNRGSIYFEMNNIPGLSDEPYMDSRNDYLQKVVFQLSAYGRGDGFNSKYMTSWEEVTRELNVQSGFGNLIGKNIPGTDDFIKEVQGAGTAIGKMNKVYNYVQRNMNWNGLYRIYAPDGLKTAWQKKSGSTAEINFVLINLLREAGLEVYPILVSERWHGRVDASYPFIGQFSSVIACVKINGTNYYLDAKEKYNPANMPPYSILNTTAFVVNKKNGGLVNIVNDSLQYREAIYNELKVAADGTVEGNTKVSSAEYARAKKVEQYTEHRTDFFSNNFKDGAINIDIKKFDVNNMGNDSLSFDQHCSFTSKLGITGDYSFIPLNLFSGFIKNPFTSNKRFSNINFGYKRSINIITEVSLPEGFVIEALPQAVKLMNPEKDITMTRSVDFNKGDNKLLAVIKIDFTRSLYDSSDYDVLQAFYKKMFEYLDEPVLLKKQ